MLHIHLLKSETAYAQIEHECLTLVFGIHHFHQYLYGQSFILVTDHCPHCKIVRRQGQKNVFTTVPAKPDHEGNTIKCVGGRQLHEY